MTILDGSFKAPAVTKEVTTADKTTLIIDNPEYDKWLAQDQLVLGHLLNSLSKEVLAQVATLTTAAEVWSSLEGMYAAQSYARVANLRMQLSNLKKGSMSITVYYAKMRAIGDELAAAGKPIEDEEMVTAILTGLDYDYNAIVSSVLGRADQISLSELYSQLMSYETHLQMYQD